MGIRWQNLIVALDLDNREEIEKVVAVLSPYQVKFKIGSIAFTRFGPDMVREFVHRGVDIFLDLKLHDIPNTMRHTASIIADLGCWAFTVHLRAGQPALRQVCSAVSRIADKCRSRKPLVLGVTVLTSSPAEEGEAERLVTVAADSGLDGVIASPLEAAAIKSAHPQLMVLTPGIRSPLDEAADQRRTATARTAFNNRADYIIVGRPIISKEDYARAAEEILSA